MKNIMNEAEVKNELFSIPIIPVEEPTAVYAEIDGYWKDDETAFTSYLVKLNEDCDEDDDKVFYYFASLEVLEDAVQKGAATANDFVITSFKLIEQ